ncbi:MAG: lytic murein transglycosylase [Betaproteobacteria bacterium]
MRLFVLATAAAATLASGPQSGVGAGRPGAGPTAPRAVEQEAGSFADFLAGIRADALARGIRAEVVDEALASVQEPQPVVIDRDRSQPETVLPLETYIDRQVTRRAIRTGHEQFARHRRLLQRVERDFGVSPSIIVAIWGVESKFGRVSGTNPIVPALATLAWDRRRGTYFRNELLDALEIVNRGDIDLDHLRGSWAGAMGQAQFMPSTYLAFAQDYDGDGRRDIWSSPGDVFASIANYLRAHGWTGHERWGREVSVGRAAARRVAAIDRRDGTCSATREMTIARPLTEWRRMGVRLTSGRPLPRSRMPASLVTGSKRSFLVYGNYDVLLEYNCATSYALSVGLLSDTIR